MEKIVITYMKVVGALIALALILHLGVQGAVAADNDPVPYKTDSEPIVHTHKGGELSVADINAHVDSANFIVEGGCSGTLISVEFKLIQTAFHCVSHLVNTSEEDVVENGEIVKKKTESLRDAKVEQKYYTEARNVGSATYQAEFLAYDKDVDLALLQIRAEKIPMTTAVHVFADHHGKVERGDAVWAMGNPLGLDASVSFGHIASTTRMFKLGNGTERTFFQTDAGMMTFGNSGGALLKGHYLIGVPVLTAPGTPVSLSVPYTFVQGMLTDNCYEEVWNDNPKQTFAECDADRKAEDEDKETVEDLLRKFLEGQSN